MEPIVSIWKMIGMVVTAVVSIGVPITLLVIWRKKTGAKVSAAICGALMFVLFVFVLENACHQLFIFGSNGLSSWIHNHVWAYVLYGGLAAGIFEETARLISFRWLLRKQNDRSVGVMYGIGHGGMEAILIAGVSMISNFFFAISLNAGGADALLAQAVGQETMISAAIESIKSMPASMFFVSGAERITAMILQIALSVLVFQAARRSGKWYLYPVAILLHAAVDWVAVLYQVGLLANIIWVEIIVLAMTLVIAFWVYRLYRADAPRPQEPAELIEP
ncbi:MAG: YhfC family glutamic-type intramembrane protease [Clostridia bacterium]